MMFLRFELWTQDGTLIQHAVAELPPGTSCHDARELLQTLSDRERILACLPDPNKGGNTP